MSNRKRSDRARAAQSHGLSADVLFERALCGDQAQSSNKFDPRSDRKTLQLCRQVQRALMLALAGECGDDLLRDVSIDSVQPIAGSHLLVQVIVPNELSVMEVLAHLNGRLGKLRALVAASICRKRVPMLSFIAIAPTSDQGADHG